MVCFINTLTYYVLRLCLCCGTVEGCLEKVHIESNSQQPNGKNWSVEWPNIRCHIFRCSAPKWCSMQPTGYPTTKSPAAWIRAGKSLANGASVFSRIGWRAWKNALDRVAPGLFPPELIGSRQSRDSDEPGDRRAWNSCPSALPGLLRGRVSGGGLARAEWRRPGGPLREAPAHRSVGARIPPHAADDGLK